MRPSPPGWSAATLADLATLNCQNWEPSNGDTISYLDLSAIPGPNRIGAYRIVKAVEAPSRARRRIHDGDVLVSTVRPYLRAFAVVRNPPANAVASTGFAVLHPKNPTDSTFILQLVLQEDFVAFLTPRMTGTGYPAVRGDDVMAYPLTLPPPDERRAITRILDSIDDAVEKTAALIEGTERVRQGLRRELLTTGLQGRHQEWRAADGIGMIPVNWRIMPLGKVIAASDYGINAELFGRPVGVPVLRMSNLVAGEVDYSNLKWAEPDSTWGSDPFLKQSDILFNRTNSIDLVGKASIVRELPGPMSFASYLVRLRTNSCGTADWLIELLNLEETQRRLRRLATKGASQANINPTNLRSLEIAVPPIEEQQSISAILDAVRTRLGHERRVRDSLLSTKRSVA